MAKNRISTQEIAEILIKNISKLKETNIAMEQTAHRITTQIKMISNSTLKVEKPDSSEIKTILNDFKKIQNEFTHQTTKILNEIAVLKTKNSTRLPNPLVYTLIGFSLLSLAFVFTTYKLDSHNQLKQITEERDYYLKILQNIPQKERKKYMEK